MVHGMKVFVEEFVRVHPAVKEILPSVDNESIGHPIEMRAYPEQGGVNLQGEEKLCSRNTPPV